MPSKTKSPKGKAAKTAKPKSVKKALKNKAKSNGKPTNDKALSAPMQAGLAAVAAMKPEAKTPEREGRLTKLARISELLKRPEGATMDEIIEITGWQKHTARAAISHALRKKHGYHIVSDKPKDGKRIYKITEPEQ